MKLKREYREDVLIVNSSWKGWFPPGTLEKGLDHYESGAVSDLKTTECGYEAVVLGSREYHVEIELNDGEISGMYCDCPYADDGSFCKHMAAVLFEIEDQEEDETEDEREPSGTYSISQTVGALPEAFLRKLVIELAQRDEALKDQLLSEYEERRQHRRKEGIRREIRRIMMRHVDPQEGVAHESYVEAMKRILRIHMEVLMERGDFLSAFELVCAVFVQSGNQELSETDGEELARVCCACWEKIVFRGGSGVRLVMREWLSLHGTDGTVNALFEDHARTFYRQLLEIEEAHAGAAA